MHGTCIKIKFEVNSLVHTVEFVKIYQERPL